MGRQLKDLRRVLEPIAPGISDPMQPLPPVALPPPQPQETLEQKVVKRRRELRSTR